ncbi:DUF6417 family protein [Streptomyces sp. NPDC005507]|uniref:DUF6417 family protein n=2 Tax=unclassified Streptomyces TaxID=2593676 RepID=UPI0033B3F76C
MSPPRPRDGPFFASAQKPGPELPPRLRGWSGDSDALLSALRVVRNARCIPPALVRVEVRMDANEHTAVADLIPTQDDAARRLALLTHDEAHDLLRLLQLIASEGADELSQEADWFAREIAARIPSDN